MLNFKEKTVNVSILNDFIIIRGEGKNSKKGYKINLSIFKEKRNIFETFEKMTLDEVEKYLSEKNIDYELVEFI